MGWVEVEVPRMQSFRDLKVIKTNFNRISTLFLWSSQKAASILYEFLHEVGQSYCANTHCSHGYTYITSLLYLMFISIQHVTIWNRVIHSCRCTDPLCSGCVHIWHLCVTMLQLVTCCISTQVQCNSGVFIETCDFLSKFGKSQHARTVFLSKVWIYSDFCPNIHIIAHLGCVFVHPIVNSK